MKKILILLLISLAAVLPAGSQNLVTAEYYYDSDPGIGNGTPVSVVTGDSVTKTFTFDVTGLDPGFHNLFIRVRDELGNWSLVRRHLFHVYDDALVDLTIDQPVLTGFEYFFDQDPGTGNGIWVPATAGDNIQETLNFSTAGLDPGFHRIMVRARDASGRWGHLIPELFYVFDDAHVDLSRVSSRIVRAEYFFDKDTVPHGKGTALSITPGNEVTWSGSIPVTGLKAGSHNLFIRVQDSIGLWSIVSAKQFSVVGLASSDNSPICQGSTDGWAKVSIIGGKPPFTYLWDDPEQQSDSTATGLKAGTYTVTVTDAEGSVLRETIEITEFDTIQINIQTADNTECKMAEGTAEAFPSGDNPPFYYLWTNGSETYSASGLKAGIYEVTVTDNIGCQNKAVATINDLNGPKISTEGRVQHLNCARDADGIIDPLVSGGTPPYAYAWSNGEATKGIQNLKGGTYELTVTDAQGCIATSSVRVNAPLPLTFSLSVVEADCGTANGAATVSVKGGTLPYAYNWTGLTAPHNASRTGLAAGVYTVNVTDNNGCTAAAQVAVSEKGAPAVNVISVKQSPCGQSNGSIQLAVSGGTGLPTYNWRNEAGSTVGTNKDLTNASSGIYRVSVSDGSGCYAHATATIPAEQPPGQPICLVTVDTLTGRNLIVWDKTTGYGIVGYRLYRETTSAGVFDSIAFIPVDSLSFYTDAFADPTIRSWRYKLAAVNSCGVESRLSTPHKTMHLTISLGLMGRINLHWNHYEGYGPKDGSYHIWRHTPGIGWELIQTQPVSNEAYNSFTDDSPPDADLWYYVEAVHPAGCTPLKASTLNSSRSNRINKLKQAPESVRSFVNDHKLIVYPNPNDGLFRILMEIDKTDDLEIKVFDISGKLVYLDEFENIIGKWTHEIDLSRFDKGLYQLQLKTHRGVFNKTVVIQ